ncbi:colicin V production protein [Azospirillum baldaniorum]|uniref:Colicin V production protein n=2 Tax=Azospirillum TaxID=191 RepID=A0A9P1JR15_9PROT|nr:MULTISPECIES: CvpA family protein [Azospirillum]AWJ89873.1 colicin V production protein [Azospirillum baldaniorum]NUB10131.1 CvpA family protein [Azospirillum baldaniorum]QCO13925.1 CvpA family protein [Azospirillum brasilense]TWA59647.1 membrane protein required for colicin V production [Azospirillum baldaniorum]TWA75445.1 membrane protein required for colicin V production [Azospirillum brasilense]
MDTFPINPADLAVIVVLLLSALLAFTRGMVAEVLSVAAWVGAALITLNALPHVLPIAQTYIHVEMAAYAASAVALFVVSLVVLTILGRVVSRGVQNSGLSALDRSLGFVFGLLKGAILASVAYLFFAWLVPNPAEHPAWLQSAKTRPMLVSGASMIYEVMPESLRKDGLGQMDMARERARQAVEAKEALDRLSTPVPGAPKTGGASQSDTGYKDRDRGDLERLIQNAR